MEIFDIQILLKDGNFADYQVQNNRSDNVYHVYQGNNLQASFVAEADGGWSLAENPAQISDDLQQRITNQLNGFRS